MKEKDVVVFIWTDVTTVANDSSAAGLKVKLNWWQMALFVIMLLLFIVVLK